MPHVSTEGTLAGGGEVWVKIQHLYLLGVQETDPKSHHQKYENRVSRCCQSMVVSRGPRSALPSDQELDFCQAGRISHHVHPEGRWPSTGVTVDATAGLGKAALILGCVMLSLSDSRK